VRDRRHVDSETLLIEQSTGNAFADLALPDADERPAKALLSWVITQIMQQRAWSPAVGRVAGAGNPRARADAQ
jgi:hypothetical protein